MEKEKMNELFCLLSKLLDDTMTEDMHPVLRKMDDLYEDVNEKIIPTITKVPYEKKYDVVKTLKEVFQDILLYLYFPELINVSVIEFFQPGAEETRAFCMHFFRDRFTFNKIPESHGLSDTIPTIIHGDTRQTKIKLLNTFEKMITLSDKEYLKLLDYAVHERLDLAGLSNVVSVAVSDVGLEKTCLIIPRHADVCQEYCISMLHAADVLVIRGTERIEEVYVSCKNLSEIYVYGKIYQDNWSFIKKCFDKGLIVVKYFPVFTEVLDYISGISRKPKTNFCYSYCVRNILSEISWYLAARIKELNESVNALANDLIYNYEDNNMYVFIVQLREEIRNKINQAEKVYVDYEYICDELIQKIQCIQGMLGIMEGSNAMNEHISMDHVLLDLMIKSAGMYKVFQEDSDMKNLRHYYILYRNNNKNSIHADVVFNDFQGKQPPKIKSELFQANLESIFFQRKLIDLHESLQMTKTECAEIIKKLPLPLRNIEKRLLGENYLEQRDLETAKKYLVSAMENGDYTAGEILVKRFPLAEWELCMVADYGIIPAAYRIGKSYYDKMKQSNDSHERARAKCLLYLHIAASKNSKRAIELLGNISFDDCIKLRKPDKCDAKLSLKYYLIIYENNIADTEIQEKICYLYYYLEDFRQARRFCQKIDTGYSNYLMSLIYQEGRGCAADAGKARIYYQRAIDKGYHRTLL